MFDTEGSQSATAGETTCGEGARAPEYVIDYEDGPTALTALKGFARAENIAAAHKILSVSAFVRRGVEEELDLLGEDNAYRCGRGAEMEVGLALGIAPSTCQKFIEIGDALDCRLPATRTAFLAGRLDFARANSIVWHTGPISDDTLAMIEAQIVDGALQLSPGRLIHEIMRLLIKANPEEATRVRKHRQQTARRVSITADSHGMAKLYGALTAEEGRAVSSLIAQMAATVCKDDPRTYDTVNADAFVALMHGESFLCCKCGNDDCTTKHLPQRERPKADVQLHIDLETLLGLLDDPAFLTGHGPIDPELARRIAADATWQAIFTDARKVDEQRKGNGDSGEGQTDPPGSKVDEPEPDASGENAAESPEPESDPAPEGDNPTAADDDVAEPEREAAGCEEGRADHDTTEAEAVDREVNADAPTDGETQPEPKADAGPKSGATGSVAGSGCESDTPTAGAPPWAPTPTDPKRHRTRHRPAGPVPPPPPPPDWQDPPLPPPKPVTDTTPTIADVLAAIEADQTLLDGEFPDGHGGFDTPPPGALTYKPSKSVRTGTFDKYPTCTFPGCLVPAPKCDWDHEVEYDPDNPEAGGWTIESNGHPACGCHHQAKTDRLFRVVRLAGDVIVWISRNGSIGITLPTPRPEKRTKPKPAKRQRSRTPPPPDPAIYEPTWWETHMHPDDRPPTLADLTTITAPDHLAQCEQLRAHYDQHEAILRERFRYQPPPF